MSMTPSQKIEELKTKFSSLQAIEKDLRALRVDASGEKDDKLKQYVAIEQEIDRGLADLWALTLDAALQSNLDILKSEYNTFNSRVSADYANELSTLKGSLTTPSSSPSPKKWLRQSTKERARETWSTSNGRGKTAIVWWLAVGAVWLRRWLWWSKKTSSRRVSQNREGGNDDVNIVINNGKQDSRLRRNWLWLVWWWATAIFGRKYLKKIPLLSDMFEKKLNFEDALLYTHSQLEHINEDELNANRWPITFDEWSSTICSFTNQRTTIDKDKKKIAWLDVGFEKHEELIFAANLVNALKARFAGKCSSPTPFYIADNRSNRELSWDIFVKMVVEGWKGEGQFAISAGYWSTLKELCPSLNEKANRIRFINYLNSLGIRIPGNQEKQENPANDPVITALNTTLNDIVNTGSEYHIPQGRERDASFTINSEHPNIYTLTAWWQPLDFSITKDAQWRVTTITIEDFPLSYDGAKLSEAIRVGLLTCKFVKEFGGNGRVAQAFEYSSSTIGRWAWIYFDYKEEYRVPWISVKKHALTRWALEQKYPYLLQHIEEYIGWLNTMQNTNNVPLWNNTGGTRKRLPLKQATTTNPTS